MAIIIYNIYVVSSIGLEKRANNAGNHILLPQNLDSLADQENKTIQNK